MPEFLCYTFQILSLNLKILRLKILLVASGGARHDVDVPPCFTKILINFSFFASLDLDELCI